jgi:hypothetical protein
VGNEVENLYGRRSVSLEKGRCRACSRHTSYPSVPPGERASLSLHVACSASVRVEPSVLFRGDMVAAEAPCPVQVPLPLKDSHAFDVDMVRDRHFLPLLNRAQSTHRLHRPISLARQLSVERTWVIDIANGEMHVYFLSSPKAFGFEDIQQMVAAAVRAFGELEVSLSFGWVELIGAGLHLDTCCGEVW